ncbi:hypothetical protein C482_13770 [Natrialba chahannaoensis JCM 10990]|uniref:Uncharacterized protein n=1 Tax=Natrialba chahannaoensis JCM 10990 TaxID=1227492 RepID=M0AFZ1_9EURY|nr:hypothetical protein C482_13770 [Natrialba chahannaoensis JCM 10990]
MARLAEQFERTGWRYIITMKHPLVWHTNTTHTSRTVRRINVTALVSTGTTMVQRHQRDEPQAVRAPTSHP